VAEYGSATRPAETDDDPIWKRTSSIATHDTPATKGEAKADLRHDAAHSPDKMKMRNKIATTKQLSLPYTVGLTRVQPTVARENFYFSFEFFFTIFCIFFFNNLFDF